LYRIDSHNMGTNVACKLFSVANRALGNARHMAIDTCDIFSHYRGSLVLGLLIMAMFTERASCLHPGFTEQYHTNMQIVMSNLSEESVSR
jgi:hypothetical protein